MQKEISIKCRGLQKTYGSGESTVEALKPTDLDIYKKDLTLLVGPSGSGKTTLISIIATILTPDSGELVLLGQNIESMDENEKTRFRGQHIGIVFQSLFLIPALSVLENIALPLIIGGGVDESTALKKAKEYLDRVHLVHKSDVSPAALSKGQQQRVAIARAMINNAAIIICDEPTSALDHTAGFEIMEFLHEISSNDSKTVLVVTHDPRIFSYADRIIPMSDGEITPEGPKNE